MSADEKLRLMNELVDLDNRIVDATTTAGLSPDNVAFEQAIEHIRNLRRERVILVAQIAAVTG